MTKRSIALFVIALICITVSLAALLWCNTPKKDTVPFNGSPREYLIAKANEIDHQTGNECAAYACAYVLRHMGVDIDGDTLYPEIKRVLGLVPVSSLVKVLEDNGLDAAAYHGTVDTLKERLCQGTPVIVFTKIPGDTHYMVAVGYDDINIYLVDSMEENSNVENEYYDRVLTIDEFERLWKTNMYFVNNIYIVVE